MIQVAEYIFEKLAEAGIKHVFMLPGGGAMYLVDAIGRCEELEYVPLLHEQSCAIAAEAYSRVTGNIGACLVTTGPGGTNAITGVAGAWLESTPVIIISGQVKTTDLKSQFGVRQLGIQELGIVDIVSPITKYAKMLTDAKDTRYVMEKALYTAKEGRQGPVWIDVPLDIQSEHIDPDMLEGFIPPKENAYQPDMNVVKRVAKELAGAKRPVLLIGQGADRAGARGIFMDFAGKLNIPVLTTWLAEDIIPSTHPLNMGKPGMIAARSSNFTMQNSDLILSIGVRLDQAVIGYEKELWAPDAKKYVVDIDQREIDKLGRFITEGVCCDAKAFMLALLEVIDTPTSAHTAWLKRCTAWREKYPVTGDAKPSFGVNSVHFAKELGDIMREGDIVINGSSGCALDTFWIGFDTKKDQRVIATGGLGSMGFGIPAAIGGAIASGSRIVTIDGDGGFQMNIQELAVISARSLPIKFFVMNNAGYGAIRNMQDNHFESRHVATTRESRLYLPELERIANAYGIPFYSIDGHYNMRKNINAVLSHPGPALCEVICDPDIKPAPRVVSRIGKDGKIRSAALHDMFPFLDEDKLKSEFEV